MKLVSVGISEYKLAEQPDRLITYGLGSCVAIGLYCQSCGVAAMSHVMLPMAFNEDENINPGKYADTSIRAMLALLDQRSIQPRELVAKIAGGADMFSGVVAGRSRRIGVRNTLSARKTLEFYGVPLLGEEVGGTVGRTVEFDTVTGNMVVRTLKKDVTIL